MRRLFLPSSQRNLTLVTEHLSINGSMFGTGKRSCGRVTVLEDR